MSSDVPYPRGLPRRASMVVHLEANGLEARFWIATVPDDACQLKPVAVTEVESEVIS